MGIRSGNFVFLRPAQHGGKDRTGRPGSREKEIEFEREIPQTKNPSGLSDRGALSQNRYVLGGACGACGNPRCYVRIQAILTV